jgi:ribosomal protein S27AE
LLGSGRVIGIILVFAGIIIGAGAAVWLLTGMNEGTLRGSGAALGFVLIFGVVVLPLLGGGIYLVIQGRSEAREMAGIHQQQELLAIVETQGKVKISDLVLQLKSTKDGVVDDIHALVGRGLFSGYIDWQSGTLYSVEASKLNGRQTCPNCGGQLEIAGKGVIKCPYCGAEIFV